ncbi:STAS domain-containing protein [Actinokineospora iranica]|uniref:Anti-sigma factor antagonist n=1 Tax=Actinokineospora iranica TaxID=1271860 RepID=A0A1G6RVY6_9PSEU|nr:STAS domain-containing protein [Actinokineospora iranica]SDD08601.1 anti-sigma B factor antagonist [Actinokineospora iranica]
MAAPARLPAASTPRAPAPPAQQTNVRVERVSRWATVATLRGEIDLRTVPDAGDTLRAALRTPDLLALVLDLSEVDFLAAAGIGLLLDLRDGAEARAVDLRVVAASRPVLRPLEVTGLREAFQLHADRADALRPYAA